MRLLGLLQDTERLHEANRAQAGLDVEFRKLLKVERDSIKQFWSALLHLDRVAFRQKEKDFLKGKERPRVE